MQEKKKNVLSVMEVYTKLERMNQLLQLPVDKKQSV